MKRILALSLLTASALSQPVVAQEPLKPVKLVTAVDGSTAVKRHFFGHVVARQTVDLAFQVDGQLVEFPVIEGAVVPKGNLIAQLDLEPFELSLEQARLQRDQAQRTATRLDRLSSNTASQVAIDDAATALALADVAVRNAEYALDHATLHAPFDALVATRNVANFTTIGAGTPVVRLHDMSEVRIEVDIPEVLFLRANKSPDLEIVARFPASDRLFPAVVREFNAETSEVAQSFRVTLGIVPEEGMNVLPGASATIIASIPGEADAGIDVPHTAVFVGDDGKTYVMVFTPKGAQEGQLTRTEVVVEPTLNGGLRIVSGLEPGEEVVAAGGSALKDGQTVRRFAGFGN
ncbi:efflux RND transporter periplasmic adaptor subunit [Aliishimia ponticola]|uniref:Efflux RND transporter periplasmic adaptor subunit n=2 Tax=Aliishimia ponticola TaxID=2499833 RepID=A0A4V3XKB5_9RHOB|nr:efflux RND transporter periplasmic adaptor subunit [Aliishimia ponticola]THH36273.1 efflux RND transporter periplasmic adaptor subunit [Aliishimia ponticola]